MFRVHNHYYLWSGWKKDCGFPILCNGYNSWLSIALCAQCFEIIDMNIRIWLSKSMIIVKKSEFLLSDSNYVSLPSANSLLTSSNFSITSRVSSIPPVSSAVLLSFSLSISSRILKYNSWTMKNDKNQSSSNYSHGSG